MSTDLSFNKEKMKVECGKLLRISNLGEKTLLGYIQNLKQSNDFSDLEWRFLKETTNLLIPSSVYVCAEYEDKEAIVEWNKALIKATLGGTALPYFMTHTEEIHCLTKENILTLYRKRYFFQNLYWFLTNRLVKLKEDIDALIFDCCDYGLDLSEDGLDFGDRFGEDFCGNFYQYLFSFVPLNSYSGGGADDYIIYWLAANYVLPNNAPFSYLWYLVDDDGLTHYKELAGWTLRGTSVMIGLKDDICNHARLMLDGSY